MAQEYYDSDDIGTRYGLPGTGLVGLMVGDQLHPPMVDDESIWSEGKNWKKGAIQCTERLADLANISDKDHILDVGCGIGGPALILARDYKSRVTGLNPSELQLETARIRTKEKSLTDKIDYIEGRAENIPLPSDTYSCVWAFNMFYHIEDKQKAVEEFKRVLKPGGRIAFDDWLLTDKADKEDIASLRHHWSSPSWITDNKLKKLLEANGFEMEVWNDYTHVGKGVMKDNFARVFDKDFRPEIASINEWGNQMADDFKTAVELTIDLYSKDKLCYSQFIATIGC